MNFSKVEAEGKKEEAAFEKFMCYCKNSGGDLQESIDNANTKIPELESAIEAAASKKAQLEKDVEEHQNDRASAETAMAEATEVREKEKAAFDKLSSDQSTNLQLSARPLLPSQLDPARASCRAPLL